MAQVFISYAHVIPDQELAGTLCNYLESRGFRVFVDSKIRLGEDWASEIDRQLRATQYFVPLLSEKSIQSDMVRREIALAYRLKKNKSLTILPVRIDLEGELPYDIGAYLDLIQYTSWSRGQSFDAVCRDVLEVMTKSSEPGTVIQPDSQSPSPARTEARKGEAARFDRAELDRLKQKLAIYIGPLARIMVDRASEKALNWNQLYEMLAAEVPAGEDRKRFLKSQPASGL